MAHRDNSAIISLRTLSTLTVIIVGIIIATFICLAAVSAPCVSNFYSEMPQYPSAILDEQTSSTFNWIGIGDLNYTWLTADDSETVRAWFDENADALQAEAGRARIAGEEVPATWTHQYTISPLIDGTEIYLEAQCLN